MPLALQYALRDAPTYSRSCIPCTRSRARRTDYGIPRYASLRWTACTVEDGDRCSLALRTAGTAARWPLRTGTARAPERGTTCERRNARGPSVRNRGSQIFARYCEFTTTTDADSIAQAARSNAPRRSSNTWCEDQHLASIRDIKTWSSRTTTRCTTTLRGIC